MFHCSVGLIVSLVHHLLVLILSIISVPLQITVAILIAMTSGLPVFFSQKRAGKNGRPFVMYKFRSMRRSAEKEQKTLRSINEARGPVFKIHNDPRFTFLGKYLAHIGLDELPQLYNVLRGDMALFGPRPLPVSETATLTPWQNRRHAIKPGIISPWIVNGYHSQSFDAWMKSDIAYIREKSLWYDLRLACRTVKLLVSLSGRALKEALRDS